MVMVSSLPLSLRQPCPKWVFHSEQIDLYMKLADIHRDGEIKYHELLKMKMDSLLANDNSVKEKELGSMFDTLDKNNDCFIDSSIVKIAMVALDGNLTLGDVDKRMQKFYAVKKI